MLLDQDTSSSQTRDQYHWQLQSEQISRALSQHGLQTNGMTGSYDAGSFRFDIRSHLENGAEKLRSVAKDVIMALGVNDINIRQRGDSLQLRVPRSPEVAVPLLDLLAFAGNVPKVTAVLGLDEDNKPVLFDFGSKETPHFLVSGGLESGKTSMLRTIAVSLALTNRQSDVQLVVICPSASDAGRQQTHMSAWMPINYLPHMLCDVTSRHTEIAELLDFLSREVAYRERNTFRVPRIVVLIDQVDTVISRGGRQCAEALLQIAQKGEGVGIHLALGSRNVGSDSLSSQLLANLPVRLVGRAAASEMRRIVPVEVELDLEGLLGEGDFAAFQNDRTRRLQGAFISDYDLHMSLSRISQPQAILLAEPLDMRVRLPKTSMNGVGHAQTKAGYATA